MTRTGLRSRHLTATPLRGPGSHPYLSPMSKPATIGRLARAAAVPVSTLRYWEHEGLLRPDGRTDANYRWYGPEALRRVRFIRVAQSVSSRS